MTPWFRPVMISLKLYFCSYPGVVETNIPGARGFLADMVRLTIITKIPRPKRINAMIINVSPSLRSVMLSICDQTREKQGDVSVYTYDSGTQVFHVTFLIYNSKTTTKIKTVNMPQDTSQKFFLWGIFLIAGVCILMWLLQRRCYYCQNKCYECDDDFEKLKEHGRESFSPYRRTGGCPPRTGYNYLDAYEQEDYYQKYPYIYPTPTNYVRALYTKRREQNAFIEAQKIQLAREYAAQHKIYE